MVIKINGVDYITSGEASKRAGVTAAHITLLCKQGRLAGIQVGRSWMIDERAFGEYVKTPRRGWPRRGASQAIA